MGLYGPVERLTKEKVPASRIFGLNQIFIVHRISPQQRLGIVGILFQGDDKDSMMQCALADSGPALTDDSGNDSEYEYEYSEVETDVFYVGLDLTSSHGLARRSKKGSAQTPSTGGSTPTVPPFEADSQLSNTEQDADGQDSLQILDLHSRNPIISSYNQIFTCSWADTVGTELVFAQPYNQNEPLPLRKHDDYTLISASRVKIIGQKANLLSKSKSSSNSHAAASLGQAQAQTQAQLQLQLQVQTAEPIHTHRANMSNQARFLETLGQVKHSKGETDAVRTTFPQKRNQNTGDRLQGWARTEAAIAEIERLNQQAIEGDSTALANLMQIYDSRSTNTDMAGEQEPRSGQAQDEPEL